MKPIMKCGHVSNAILHNGDPICASCFGISENAAIVLKNLNLKGRKAVCVYCACQKKSSANLAFFHYKPNEATDSFYCGCKGWN